MDEEKGKKAKKPKKEAKAYKKPKVDAEAGNPDFVHLVRLSGVVVDGNLILSKALTKVKGIGLRLAETLIGSFDISKETKIGNLDEKQIQDIEERLEKISTAVPVWMLNRKKDVETGESYHRLGPELDMQTREDINREKKIKSYRGVRHTLNLPCRGQRTRSTFRKGSTIGVSRKKS